MGHFNINSLSFLLLILLLSFSPTQGCVEKCDAVVEADPDSSAPFKEKMNAFFREARAELANEQQALLEARGKFKAVMQFYQYKPKGTNLDAADPNAFFSLWLGFCQDFKVTWKTF